MKKVINAVRKKNHQQTIADAVVNRSHPIHKKKEKVVKLQGKKAKRKLAPTSLPSSKVRKYSENKINQLINSGSGIVLD